MSEEAKKYTAFVTHEGVYGTNVMAQGLTGSSHTFQRVMNSVLRGLTWKILICYLDDIIVWSDTFENHIKNLEQVFDRLRKANLKLKLRKCKFAMEQVKYLGHIVSSEGVATDPNKIKSVSTFPRPKNVSDVRSFVGLCNYYRKFIEGYAKVVSPLTELTKKNAKFKWTEECEEAFQAMKDKLTSAPILSYPRFGSDDEFLVYTDASGFALGGILAQVQDGVEKVIAYTGRKMLPAERKYSITEMEMLAVYHAIRKFDCYIRFHPITVITDHSPLVWIFKKQPTSNRICKWSFVLNQYNLKVQYRAGKLNHCDPISRREYPEPSEDEIEPPNPPYIAAVKENPPVQHNKTKQKEQSRNDKGLTMKDELGKFVALEQVAKYQREDPLVAPLIEYMETGNLPDDRKTARKIVFQADQYDITNGVLYHHWYRRHRGTAEEKFRRQIVIPENLKAYVLKQYHDQDVGGHRSTAATELSVKWNYYWVNMHSDIQNWIDSCTTCAKKGPPPQKKDRAPLSPLPVGSPFAHVEMDIAGPFTETTTGMKAVLVVYAHSQNM